MSTWLRGFLILSLCLLAFMSFDANSPAGAEDGPRSGEDKPCPVGKSGNQSKKTSFGACVDDSPPPTEFEPIWEAKAEAVKAYTAFNEGQGDEKALQKALDRLAKLTGKPVRQTKKSDGITIMGYVGVSSNYQINSYYCGPATAQNILGYLGPSSAWNPYVGWQTINGNPYNDQPILAGDYWLATDYYGGTNWGYNYMPFTLNTWHGGGWYELAASSLGSFNLKNAIDFDTNNGHPVAENIIYAPWTYFPPGFSYNPSGYQHWDTVYSSGSTTIGIAQSWPYPGAGTRTAYYAVNWSTHWSAIANWTGIVW